jgi:orotate phosphoribosyltransferase
MTDLVQMLLKTGLLQFGRFADRTGWKPYCLNLHMLPSYPDVLRALIEEAVPAAGQADRLVAAADAIPFGIGLSLRTGIPLVYSRGTDEAPVYDLVGAYDIGHPALLITGSLNSPELMSRLIGRAKQVGLEIDGVIAVIDEGSFQSAQVRIHALLNLPSVVAMLVKHEQLPAGQGKMIREWLNRHHPG